MRDLPDFFHGCKVFPCVPMGKEPATKQGWHIASSDPAQIAEWRAINPDFNWAVATGLSGLFVIDVDPAGLEWWNRLLATDEAVRDAAERAFQVRTPRGGLHIYFKGEGPSTASRIAEGIDTRGGIHRDGKIVSGGYVLLPGSKTDKGIYSALPGGGLIELPQSIVKLIPERKKTDTLGLEKNPEADKPRNVQWALDLLNNYVASGRVAVEGQGGNDLTFQVACSILDKAISPGLAFELLWEHWNPHCSPPWDDWELEGIIRNAASYGEDTGGGVKGFQTNVDAFAKFEGQEFEPPMPPERRDRIQPLHSYADNVQDPTWLIPGLLPAHGIGMLYGESGSFKSFLALDMALCLAFGIPGQWNAPPVKNDILFFAGEGPVATAKKRWPAWMDWQGMEFRNDHRFFISSEVPLFSDTQAWENVKLDLAELKAKPSLIVIDTLSRLITGMDESAAKDTSLVIRFLEQIARYFECFVLVIHHEGKDKNKGARGSSAWYAGMDTVLSTKKKVGGTELRVRKQKDADVGEEGHDFAVKEIGASIVLERGASLADLDPKKQTSRYAWASVEEITGMIQKHGGELSENVLIQEIASAHGIDRAIVQQQLTKNDALTFLRPTKGKYIIPRAGYDL